jgi:hypothetical protein
MKSLEPTNHRISNSLFDAINRVRNGILESTVATEGAVDKAHFCATHVEHALLGQGVCISEQHAEPDENGDIAWYSVEFPSGIQRVNTSNLKITEGKSHSHGKKMAEEEEVEQQDEATYNHKKAMKSQNPRIQKKGIGGAMDNAAKRIQQTFKDVPRNSLEKSYKEEVEQQDEAMSQQASTTMKHIPNASPALKKAAKDIKPGVSGYRDRVDMLKAGGVAQEGTVEEGNDGNLANNAKPYNKVTHGDVITGRLGKDEMGGKKKKETSEARSTGTVFDKPKDNPLTKDIKSSFNKKQISTGTVYTKKPQKDTGAKGKKMIGDSVTQTIINHNDFVLEVTDNPSYSDYLKALQSMVGQSSEEIQQEIVTIATEAFNEQYTDIIIESQTKKIFESKFEDIRMSGGKVLGENYMVDSGEPYVEYTVEKDGKAIQYVHLGTIKTV